MRTTLGIFWHDLRQLLRNPFALVVVLGLVVLPSVYAWYSVAAMWNPYSHTDGLKVAVVNEDAGATYRGKEIRVGDMLVEGMGRDRSFDWQFVDSSQGKAGLDSGEYYAEFILPDTFSGDFISVLTGDLQHPTIEYWVNEKYNAVALEVTDAGAGVVDAVINRVFSALIADALSDVVKDVAADIIDVEGKSSSQVQSSLAGASRDLENVLNGLAGVDASLEQWRDAADAAQDSLQSLKKAIPALETSIGEGRELLADVRTAVHEVDSAYSSALAEGGPELSGVLGDFSKRVKKVSDSIASKQSDISSAVAKAESALGECEGLIETLLRLDPDSKTLADLEAQNDKVAAQLSDLEDASEAFGEAASKASEASDSLSADVSKAVKGMQDRNDAFNGEVLPALDASLDSVALVMGSLDGASSTLDKQADQTGSLFGELDGVLGYMQGAVGQTSDALDEVSGSLGAAQSDLESLAGSEVMKRITDLADIDVKSYGSFMSSPVDAQLNQVYPLGSYGDGVAPFYTSLAIWVGCFMLIAVIKLEADPALFPDMKPWQGYVGRLLLLGLLALLQGVIVTVGDLVLGVQAASAAALVAAGAVAAFCFVNIVYAMAITLKHVGKALAVVFLIVQIPGASGMYPIQLMPGFFQAMYPWLPFTYSMGAIREAIGGFYGATYAQCMLWLVAAGLAALALALVVRPRLLNLNRLFDRKLKRADLYITEEHGLGADVVSDRPVIRALLRTDEGREQVLERANAFSRRYAVVRQAAPLAVVVLAVCLGLVSGVLDLGIDAKLVALALFIVAVVVVFCVCVAYEYVGDNLIAATAGIPVTEGVAGMRPVSPTGAAGDVRRRGGQVKPESGFAGAERPDEEADVPDEPGDPLDSAARSAEEDADA